MTFTDPRYPALDDGSSSAAACVEMAAKIAFQVREQITVHPEAWNQLDWFIAAWATDMPECGTRACVAGWAAHFARPDLEPAYSSFGHASLLQPVGMGLSESDLARLGSKSPLRISVVAREALNLDDDEANWLFDSERTYDEVIEGLTWLVEGRPLYPLTK